MLKPTLFVFLIILNPFQCSPTPSLSDIFNVHRFERLSDTSECDSFTTPIKNAIDNIDWKHFSPDSPEGHRIISLCREGEECFRKENVSEMKQMCGMFNFIQTEVFECLIQIGKDARFRRDCPPNAPFDCHMIIYAINCGTEAIQRICKKEIIENLDVTLRRYKAATNCYDV